MQPYSSLKDNVEEQLRVDTPLTRGLIIKWNTPVCLYVEKRTRDTECIIIV